MNKGSISPMLSESNNKQNFRPLMLKLSTMQPDFSLSSQSLEKFNIPEDYYSNLNSRSPERVHGTNCLKTSPKLKLYNSFDVYGNELNATNKTSGKNQSQETGISTIFDENSPVIPKINKENTNQWGNSAGIIKSGSSSNYYTFENYQPTVNNRSPLVNILLPCSDKDLENENVKNEKPLLSKFATGGNNKIQNRKQGLRA